MCGWSLGLAGTPSAPARPLCARSARGTPPTRVPICPASRSTQSNPGHPRRCPVPTGKPLRSCDEANFPAKVGCPWSLAPRANGWVGVDPPGGSPGKGQCADGGRAGDADPVCKGHLAIVSELGPAQRPARPTAFPATARAGPVPTCRRLRRTSPPISGAPWPRSSCISSPLPKPGRGWRGPSRRWQAWIGPTGSSSTCWTPARESLSRSPRSTPARSGLASPPWTTPGWPSH